MNSCFVLKFRVALHLLIVICAVALSPNSFAQTTLLSLDASQFQFKSTGGIYGTGWEFPTNGYIENSLSFPVAGTYQFQVQAFGTYAGSGWPRMEIRIDQKALTTIRVSSSTAKTFKVNLNVPSGLHQIELAFINDYYASGQDRNLYVNHLNVLSQTTITTSTSSTTTTTTTTVPVSVQPPTSGTVGPTISTFKASGPITLVSGQTVTGLAISNPNGPCIKGDGASNVHIYNNKIGPCGTTLDDSAVVIYNAHDVLIEHNSIDDVVTGFFAYNSSNNIVFDHNSVTRIRGVFPRGSMVQFHAVNGSGNRISCNISDQPTPGYLNGPEDQVNMYVSNGTATSPIRIAYNKIRGGGPSNSGGGINLGDNGSSYVTAEGNILVNPGQYGIAIPGGHDNKMINNKVYSQQLPWSNVGMFIWNQYTPACYNSVVSGNRVNWTDRDGLNNLGTNWWDSGNCGPTSNSNNIWGDPTIGPAIFDEVISACN